MRKADSHFFIQLIPSHSERPRKGSPTHFAKNNGIAKVDWRIAAYIAHEFNRGIAEPELFICSWYNEATDEHNVGFAVPRDNEKNAPPKSSATHESMPRKGLETLFE
jgi:hypothetical protein